MSVEPERGDWRGDDVSADEVADALSRLNREHFRHAHGHGATRTMNLVIAPAQDPAAELDEGVQAARHGARARHPSRTIVLREQLEDRLDAQATISCDVARGPGAVGYCHDEVVLHADRPRLAHADSLLAPLLLVGLPTVVWLPATAPKAVEEALAAIATTVLLDSDADVGEPAAGLARARAMAARTPVHDLAWTRLDAWRRHVAAAFQAPERRALLARVGELELDGARSAGTLLLAGWIAARAEWEIGTLEPSPDGWSAGARGGDGRPVAMRILARDRADPGATPVRHLAFVAGEDRLAVQTPHAPVGAGEIFTATLRSAAEGSPGYQPALHALAGTLPGSA